MLRTGSANSKHAKRTSLDMRNKRVKQKAEPTAGRLECEPNAFGFRSL